MGVNVAGFFFITQRAVAEMLKQGSGHVVTITTSLVDQPIAGVPAVLAALTKGGLNAATKSLAIELAAQGVRVNAVAPGVYASEMTVAKVTTVEQVQAISQAHTPVPAGRAGTYVLALLLLE